jgi:hypothetical protein
MDAGISIVQFASSNRRRDIVTTSKANYIPAVEPIVENTKFAKGEREGARSRTPAGVRTFSPLASSGHENLLVRVSELVFYYKSYTKD